MATPDGNIAACWCGSVPASAAVLAALAPGLQATVCLCPHCIAGAGGADATLLLSNSVPSPR